MGSITGTNPNRTAATPRRRRHTITVSLTVALVLSGCAFRSPARVEEQVRWAADGFALDELLRVPRSEMGSWIRLTVESDRALLASSENGRMYRITLPSGDQAVRVDDVGLEVGPAQGLLRVADALYIVQSSPGLSLFAGSRLLRARDLDGDGTYEELRTLREFPGAGEHGPHQVVAGPGDRLFLVAGNATGPTTFERSRPAAVPGEDQLVPTLDCFRPYRPRGGWVAELSPDGELELVASGLRNAYGLAVDRHGELFVFDADMEWDLGAPWYRPTRVLHVRGGGDFGWRYGSAKWPEWFPDGLPSVVDIGAASPTGVVFAYDTDFPAPWRDALILGDWSLGRIYAVHLEPEGATYRGRVEILAAGKPFPVSDLVVHPSDGAIYVVTGGRGIDSVLYRLRSTDASTSREVSSSPTPEAQLRRALEARHVPTGRAPDDQIWDALGHPDRAVRYAARVALEHSPPGRWRASALAAPVGPIRTAALLALARVGNATDAPSALTALIAPDGHAEDATGRRDRLRAIHLWLARHERIDSPERRTAEAAVVRFVDAQYPSADPGVNHLAGEILAHLGAPSARTKTLALLRSAPTQEEQIRYVHILSTIDDGWTEAERLELARWFQRAEAFSGGLCIGGFIADLEDRTLGELSWTERRRLDQRVQAAPAETRHDVAPEGPGREWTVAEAVATIEGLESAPDLERGRAMFTAGSCWSCHRFDGRGSSLGPDLSNVGARMGIDDLAEAIIAPSRVIPSQYESSEVELADGRVIRGQLFDRMADWIPVIGGTLSVRPDFRSREIVRIEPDDIVEIRKSPVSMMPTGLVDAMNEAELRDLLAWLRASGEAPGTRTRAASTRPFSKRHP